MKLLFNNSTYLKPNPSKESTPTHKAHSTTHLPETQNQHLENKFHGQDKIAAPLFDKSQEIAVHLLKILLLPPSKKQSQNKLRSKSMNNRRQWSIVDKFTSTNISTVGDELDCKPKLETEACAWPEQYFNASGEKLVLRPSGYPMCISPTRCGRGGELMKLCLLLLMKMRDDERFEPPTFACNPIANPTRRNQNCCCFPHMYHTQNRNSPRKKDLFSKLKKPAARRNPKNPCRRRHSSEYQRWCSLQHPIPRLQIRYGISLSQSRHLLSTVHFLGALNPCSSLSGDCMRPCDHYMLMNYANYTQFHVQFHKNPSRNQFFNCNREVKTDNGHKNFASVSCLLPATDRTPACGFAYTRDNTLTMCNLWCFNITWWDIDNTFSRSEDCILFNSDPFLDQYSTPIAEKAGVESQTNAIPLAEKVYGGIASKLKPKLIDLDDFLEKLTTSEDNAKMLQQMNVLCKVSRLSNVIPATRTNYIAYCLLCENLDCIFWYGNLHVLNRVCMTVG